ncbi:MAG: hypothetical protein QOE70_1021 [Chthoniobacter sp.]|jgi:hypothetical protein|nr:hypothetical protein [Chthoniobacter sp.]
MNRVFLLSPAHSGGKRAAMLTRSAATFELARQVQIGAATLGDVFTFCSGLYFRGKLTYACRFALPPPGVPGVQIITPTRGLAPPDVLVGARDLAEFSEVAVDSAEPRFTRALKASALALAAVDSCEVVLLGSVATGKYLDTLRPIFGDRLHFPVEFLGRGDMSRGALLLRSVVAGQELHYAPVPSAPPRKSRRPSVAEHPPATMSKRGIRRSPR